MIALPSEQACHVTLRLCAETTTSLGSLREPHEHTFNFNNTDSRKAGRDLRTPNLCQIFSPSMCSRTSGLCNVSPLQCLAKRSEIKVLEPRWCISMCVVVLTLVRIYERIVRLGDLLPLGWSVWVVWKILGTVLERKSLVCPA